MSDEKKEIVYEIFTVSGNRVTVEGSDILANYQIGDLSVFDKDGKNVAQFELMNIEGWRVAP